MGEEIIKYIKNNQPLFLKNYYDKNIYFEDFEELIKIVKYKKINPHKKNILIKGASYNDIDNNNLINNFRKILEKENNFIVNKKIRSWIHNKDNITRYHYDGNAIDVVNICLKGKKLFKLTPPLTHSTYPFSNISIKNKSKIINEYILESGDILLIPSLWNHEVICLEDDTITINFNLTNKDIKLPNKNIMLYKLHNFFKTPMKNESISKIIKNNKISPRIFIINYIIESKFCFILSLLINIIQKRKSIRQ